MKMKRTSTIVFLGVACCCLARIQFASCDESPVITHISKEKIQEIGDEVEFNCTVQNLQDYPLLWIKLHKDRQDRSPLSSNTALIIRDSRFSVHVDNETSTNSLRIKDLQEADTGFYQCQILISVDNKVTAEVELQIRRPPTISSNTTRSVNVTEGKPVELHCNADGFPVPRISWKRENDILLPSGGAIYHGSVLKIENIHRDDRGLYLCIAENGVGEEARANATVHVAFAPVVTAIRPRVGQAQGYTATLECKVEAHPKPVVSWHKAGAELKKETAKTDDDDFVDSLLRYSIGAADFGEYICRAENQYGIAETKVELFETIIPVCVNTCG
ncbi:lachesin [Nasonia vitripennis]|uniref:Ig-like domain-containing protein n=1 Tax=Nasonia vitripennis TaxID=7425 RepID=A0A7M7G251_NASVI|nr:lachesin [Nasonia vitripennis]